MYVCTVGFRRCPCSIPAIQCVTSRPWLGSNFFSFFFCVWRELLVWYSLDEPVLFLLEEVLGSSIIFVVLVSSRKERRRALTFILLSQIPTAFLVHSGYNLHFSPTCYCNWGLLSSAGKGQGPPVFSVSTASNVPFTCFSDLMREIKSLCFSLTTVEHQNSIYLENS